MNSTHLRCRTTMRYIAPAVLALLGVTLAGCSSPSTGPATDSSAGATSAAPSVDPTAPETTSIKAVQFQQSSSAPFFAAVTAGYPEDYGLTITNDFGQSSPAMVTQVVSGADQFATSSPWGIVNAATQGIELRILGAAYAQVPEVNTVEALPGSGIKSVSDLVGKKVGVVGLNSGTDLPIKYAMQELGLDPNSATFVDLPYGQMNASLESGAIDASTVTGPIRAASKATLNSVTIFDLGTGDFADFPAVSWVTTVDFAAKNPNTVAAFQCAIVQKGSKLVTDDDSAYAQALIDGIGWTTDQVTSSTKLGYPGTNDAEKLQIVPTIMKAVGGLSQDVDMNDLVIPVPTNC